MGQNKPNKSIRCNMVMRSSNGGEADHHVNPSDQLVALTRFRKYDRPACPVLRCDMRCS